MGRIFVTADTHFGHRRILDFESGRKFASIEEHDREIIARWNATVRKDDTVWHLGDVYFGGKDAHGVLGELNGIKRLVLGNHDVYPLECYQRYFTKIFGAATLRGCVLTHVPVHPQQLEHRFRANIHGHMHSFTLKDPRYTCVSLEQTDLKPILLESII